MFDAAMYKMLYRLQTFEAIAIRYTKELPDDAYASYTIGREACKDFKRLARELNRIDNRPLPFEGLTFSGKYLMNNGLDIPLKHKVDKDKQTDYSSRILYLEAK